MKLTKINLLDFMFFAIILICVICMPDNSSITLKILGIIIIIINIYMCFKVKENKLLLLLFGLIAFINISLGYTDCFLEGKNVSEWQSIALRSEEINIIVAKSIALSSAIINLMLKSIASIKQLNIKSIADYRKKNVIIAFSGIVVAYIILIYGLFSTNYNVGEYVSVSTPIYEYSLIILCFVWYYSKGIKIIDVLIWIFSIVFGIHFLLIGDRSSVFMLVILLAICYFYDKIKIKNIMIIGLIGIPIVNAVAIIRVNGFLDLWTMIQKISLKGFYVDTVSWAYYGSLSIASLFEKISNHFQVCFDFFAGSIGLKGEYYNLSLYAKTNFPDLYSAGGGIYASYFYAIGGYVGVIFGSYLLGTIINKIVLSNKEYKLPYKILLLVYCFRWYLYSAQTLFRGVLILTTVVYILCILIDKTNGDKI